MPNKDVEPFVIQEVKLPHEGIVPGARGHKKIVYPKGTTIYVLKYQDKYFYCGYIYFKEILLVAKAFVQQIDPAYKRHIPLKTLIEWNFRRAIPSRIHRTKEDISLIIHGG